VTCLCVSLCASVNTLVIIIIIIIIIIILFIFWRNLLCRHRLHFSDITSKLCAVVMTYKHNLYTVFRYVYDLSPYKIAFVWFNWSINYRHQTYSAI
jgi:hypothetical protein